MDWTGWMEMTDVKREAAMRRYRDILTKERDENRVRWDRMTQTQKARYPEALGK